MQYSVAYDKALEMSKDMGDSLLQRLNFFLLGTAFLIGGLATLVASSSPTELTGDALALAHIINALGLYLALFFTIVNFINIEILADFGEYIRSLERELMAGKGDLPITVAPPSIRAEEIAESKMRHFPWLLLRQLFSRLRGLLFTPGDKDRRGKTQHIYLVPILFVIGWILIFSLGLPIRWQAAAAISGPVGAAAMIYGSGYVGGRLARYLGRSLQRIPQALKGMTEKWKTGPLLRIVLKVLMRDERK